MLKFDYELLAYVIMDNHYHLIIKVNEDPLDKIMFNINNVFVRYVNKELKRSGHVYESRYKSKQITTDTYLLWVLRYIHRNPIRAKMVENLDDYKWSSHYFYKTARVGTVNTMFILNMLSDKKAKAVLSYMKFVNALGNDDNDEEDYEIVRELLDKQFNDKDITLELSENPMKREILESIYNRIFPDEVLKLELLSGSKKRYLTQLKLDFIKKSLLQKYT